MENEEWRILKQEFGISGEFSEMSNRCFENLGKRKTPPV